MKQHKARRALGALLLAGAALAAVFVGTRLYQASVCPTTLVPETADAASIPWEQA